MTVYTATNGAIIANLTALRAITTLKTAGLIITSDNKHIGLTSLGYDFYDFIQE